MMNLFIGLPLIGLAIFLILIFIIIWIWAIIDCLKSDSSGEYKLLWLLIIIFMNIFGAILYFVFAKEFNRDRKINFNRKKGKYLTRSAENKIIGGVCGGLAEHFSFDPAIIRILWVIFTIFVNGVGVLLYIIAWIAIPSQKDMKEKKKEKKKKSEQNKTQKKEKPQKKRNGLIAILLTLGIFVLLFMFVAGFVIIGNMKYNNSLERVSIKSFIVDVKSEVNEKTIINEIINSQNYKKFEGHELILLEVIEPKDDSCTLFERDPYGVKIYDSGCREFKHRFFVESDFIKGYYVNTLVSGNRLLKMTFTSFEKIQDETNKTKETHTCLSEYRNVDFCAEYYEPVCGFEEKPLNISGITFSNECFACMTPEIKYFIEGECEK